MEREQLVEMTERNLSTYEIAKSTGYSQSNVAYWLRKHGLKTKHFPIWHDLFQTQKRGVPKGFIRINHKSRIADAQFWKDVNSFYADGNTYKDCCKKYKISTTTLVWAGRKGLIKPRNQKEAFDLMSSRETDDHKQWRIDRIHEGIRNSAKQFGGYRAGAGRSKKFQAVDSFGVAVCLQSSFELRMADLLTESGVAWQRPSPMAYVLHGKRRRYFADFYLPDHDIYLDTKNDYLANIDALKIHAVIQQNRVCLEVVLECGINTESLLRLLSRHRLPLLSMPTNLDTGESRELMHHEPEI